MPIGSLQPRDRVRSLGIAALVSVIVVLNVATPMAGAASVTPRSAPAGQATAYAVIGTIPTEFTANEMALAHAHDADPRDDTLFIGTDKLYVYPPLAGTGSAWTEVTLSGLVRSLGVGDSDLYVGLHRGIDDTLVRLPLSVDAATSPLSSAVLSAEAEAIVTGPDDSVYVSYYNNRSVIDEFAADLGSTREITLPASSVGAPSGITRIVIADDTLYAGGWNTNNGYLGQLSLATDDSQSYTPGVGVSGMAVGGGRILLGMSARDVLSLNARDWDDSFSASYRGDDVAVWGSTSFATSRSADAVRIAPVSTLVAQQTVSVDAGPSFEGGIEIAGDGVAYVALDTSGVALLAPTSASLAAASGLVGTSVRVDIGLPTHRDMDDSAVTAVWWGDDTLPFTRVVGSDAVTVTAPAGAGAVPVVVALNGGGAVSAGAFTFAVPPPPPPPTPAGAPGTVVAVAGDASASVSWSAPASSGSFPVTNYQVVSSPGGRTCLTASLSCTVAGLTNGTAYTFTVRALTGAGWSAASAPSNAVTPAAPVRPSITITGSRDGGRIAVSGTTTGFGMGGELKPWLRLAGQGSFTQGVATILVSMDGSFEWSRRAGRQVSVYVATPAGDVRSNTVVVRAR
jgi:hypothetical protein